MVYKSLSFHGILAVLRITAHLSLQAELLPDLPKLPTPMLMEVLMPAGSAATASSVPAPWNAAPAAAEEHKHWGLCRGHGEPAHSKPMGSHPAAQLQAHTTRGKGLNSSPSSLPRVEVQE